MEGWIKLDRDIVNWEWYDDINTRVLYIHCLLLANHSETKYRGIKLSKGMFFVTVETLAKSTGLSIQSTRTAIRNIQRTGHLTTKKHARGTVFTVYPHNSPNQSNNESTVNLTTIQQRSNNDPTNEEIYTLYSNKNDKNDKNDKEGEKKIYRILESNKNLKVTEKQFNSLSELGFSKTEIDDVLDQIDNKSDNNKYNSLYLTAKSWLKSNSEKVNLKSGKIERMIRNSVNRGVPRFDDNPQQ